METNPEDPPEEEQKIQLFAFELHCLFTHTYTHKQIDKIMFVGCYAYGCDLLKLFNSLYPHLLWHFLFAVTFSVSNTSTFVAFNINILCKHLDKYIKLSTNTTIAIAKLKPINM